MYKRRFHSWSWLSTLDETFWS